MAVINITIPDAKLDRVLGAFAAEYGWTATISGPKNTDIPNPENRREFLKRMLVRYIRDVVRGREIRAAIAGLTPPPDIDAS